LNYFGLFYKNGYQQVKPYTHFVCNVGNWVDLDNKFLETYAHLNL